MTEPAKTPPAGHQPPRSPGTGPEGGAGLPATRRTEAFSDGVFAIVITLLVLDLTNPHYRPGQLGAALARDWPSFLAFGFSFVYIGVIWLNHHALFRRIRHLDLALNWINLGVLLGAVIIPFPTAVLAGAFADGSDNDRRLAVVLYALAAALMSAAWLAAFCYLGRHPELLRAETTPGYAGQQLGRPLTGIGLYALSGLVGWFISPVAGLICIVIMISYHAITSEGLHEGPVGRLLRLLRSPRLLRLLRRDRP
ncbi:MAG TPA: TMEM175 family protein [Trebonia sp.]|nr:TMEM175 family protein [Trebonia sp.]